MTYFTLIFRRLVHCKDVSISKNSNNCKKKSPRREVDWAAQRLGTSAAPAKKITKAHQITAKYSSKITTIVNDELQENIH